jgi:transposase-like protein
MQVFRSFPDRDACIRYLEDLRWRADPHCGSKAVARTIIKGKTGRFNCHSCRSSFSVLSGTLFHKTKIDLRKWFLAIHIVMKAKKGISSYQLARNLSMNVKSAWYMMTRIRKEMEKQEDNIGLLAGIVEADETFVGGKPRRKKGVKNELTPIL